MSAAVDRTGTYRDAVRRIRAQRGLPDDDAVLPVPTRDAVLVAADAMVGVARSPGSPAVV